MAFLYYNWYKEGREKIRNQLEKEIRILGIAYFLSIFTWLKSVFLEIRSLLEKQKVCVIIKSCITKQKCIENLISNLELRNEIV